MWQLREIGDDGTSFMVWNGSAGLARWVVDPALPWVLVEDHSPSHLAFQAMLLPLSDSSLLRPRPVRASAVKMDLLYRTDEFLDAIQELAAAASGGILMWQLDKEPKERLRLGDSMFDPKMSCDAWHAMRLEHGVRLMLNCPHANESSCVQGIDRIDVCGAWARVRDAGATS